MNSCPTPKILFLLLLFLCHWLSSILPYAHSSVTPLIFCFPPSIFLFHCVSTLYSPPSSLPSFSSLVKQVYSFFCHLKSFFCVYPVSRICMKEVSAVSVAFFLTCRTYFWKRQRRSDPVLLHFCPLSSPCCTRHGQRGAAVSLLMAGQQAASNCPSVKFLWSQIIWDAFPLKTRWLAAKFFNLKGTKGLVALSSFWGKSLRQYLHFSMSW